MHFLSVSVVETDGKETGLTVTISKQLVNDFMYYLKTIFIFYYFFTIGIF